MHVEDATLSAWLEGDLRGQERARVGAHIGSCAQCRRELKALVDVVERVREGPAEWSGKYAAWAALAARLPLTAAASAPAESHHALPGVRRLAPSYRRLIPIGAVAVAVAIAVMLLIRPAPRVDPAIATAIASDARVTRSLATATGRLNADEPGSRAVAAANREISAGIDELRRALRERPDDAAVAELLRRAVEHRAALLMEVPR